MTDKLLVVQEPSGGRPATRRASGSPGTRNPAWCKWPPSRQPCPPAPRQGTFTGRRGFGPRRTAGFGRARTSSPQASQEDLLAQAIDHGRQSVLASQQLCKAQREQVEATRKQTAVLEKGLKSVADAVKELCEIGRRQEERLRRLEENLSPLATLATSTVVVLPQQPMPGQQPPQPPQ
ncbi:uncharacterized protein LOC125759084 [Rhipicephalus sanguineus]|uniref:uncharacterized protein LOC125759084 n=1 Tax=Rhipicephalus sanguineus TaxID=34632 RepID=UPI0020C2E29A|nr:uncharacterized protein LOC125759084 [Rhipicephalus sanguineus]